MTYSTKTVILIPEPQTSKTGTSDIQMEKCIDGWVTKNRARNTDVRTSQTADTNPRIEQSSE